MMIMSQDRMRFVIVGRGATIGAWDNDGKPTVFCDYGSEEGATILGTYSSMEAAKSVVQEIYSVIEDQKENYKMPSAEKIDDDEKERNQWKTLVTSEDTPLYMTGLSTRTYNCLKRKGYYTVEQVRRAPATELLKIRNMGEKSFQELIDKGVIET